MPFGFDKEYYCLSSDSTDSRVHYAPDIFAGSPAWVSTDLTGGYSGIRPTSTAGGVYILGGEGDWCYEFDLTVSDGGWATPPGGGVYTGGVGFVGEAFGTGGGISNLHLDFSGAQISSITVHSIGSGFANGQREIWVSYLGGPLQYHVLDQTVNGDQTVTYAPIDGVPFFCDHIEMYWGGSGSFDIVVDNIIICGVGFDPFGASTDLKTRYSTDYGATFDPEETVAPAPGLMIGFDVSRIGTAVLVGAAGEVYRANSGGAYSLYATVPAGAQPNCIFIPRYVPGTASTANDPDEPSYIVGSATLTASDESLWIVDETGAFTDITPVRSGTPGVVVSTKSITGAWVDGRVILALCEFGGAVRRMAVTTNGGTSWTFSASLSSSARAVAVRKSDINKKLAMLANSSELTISHAYRTTTIPLSDRNIGITADLIGVDIYG